MGRFGTEHLEVAQFLLMIRSELSLHHRNEVKEMVIGGKEVIKNTEFVYFT